MTKATRLLNLLEESESCLVHTDRARIMELATMFEAIERSIHRSLQIYAHQCDLTLLEAQSLAAILDLEENARLSTIAESVKMPLSTMTGVAARLEKSGLVERKRATDDARASVLSLTPDGIAKIEAMFRPFFREVSAVIDQMAPGTLESLLEAFTTVRDLAETIVQSVERGQQV